MALLRYLVIRAIHSISFLPASFKLEGKESGDARKCIRIRISMRRFDERARGRQTRDERLVERWSGPVVQANVSEGKLL